LTRERCDFLVKLPQVGKIGSLNVAQACTVLAYEWFRQSQSTS
ncbi:MAG: 23S rRNA (guanosine(2251)-2'-O)-methyltransferase RlmB, partial [Actinomycetia bacterium]|nr:23S rRNA (guanosine(2251)-2'-O)-methyltransferase RlmB [Actinomycetes bacterium]